MITPTRVGIVCSLLFTSAESARPTTAIVKARSATASASRGDPSLPSGPGRPTVAMSVTIRPWTKAAVPSTRTLLKK